MRWLSSARRFRLREAELARGWSFPNSMAALFSSFHQHHINATTRPAMATRTAPFSRFAKYRDFLHGSRYVLFAVASWTPAIIFFNNHVGEVGYINGPSMSPYLNTGYYESMSKDITWINKRNPIKDLQRGMIVSFRYGFRILLCYLDRTGSRCLALLTV
jgi:hypothetical protein